MVLLPRQPCRGGCVWLIWQDKALQTSSAVGMLSLPASIECSLSYMQLGWHGCSPTECG